MIWNRCKSIAPWLDWRCQRKANHVGGHVFNASWQHEASVWFSCIECGLSTPDSLRVCKHCLKFYATKRP